MRRVCFYVCVFAVAVFLWSEWMTDLSQEKEHPSRRSLLHWFRCRSPCTDLSLLAVYMFQSCSNVPMPSQFTKHTDILIKTRSAGLQHRRINHSHDWDLNCGGQPVTFKASTVQRFTSPTEETQCLPPLPHLYLEPSSTLSILSARRRRPLHRSRPDQSTCGCPTAATVSPALPTPAAPSMECPSCCR